MEEPFCMAVIEVVLKLSISYPFLIIASSMSSLKEG